MLRLSYSITASSQHCFFTEVCTAAILNPMLAAVNLTCAPAELNILQRLWTQLACLNDRLAANITPGCC